MQGFFFLYVYICVREGGGGSGGQLCGEQPERYLRSVFIAIFKFLCFIKKSAAEKTAYSHLFATICAGRGDTASHTTPFHGPWAPLGSRMVHFESREVELRMMKEAVGPQECPGKTRGTIIKAVLAMGIASGPSPAPRCLRSWHFPPSGNSFYPSGL